jgi:hypothetical protein
MEAVGRVQKTMSICDICLRPCDSRETLCEVCRETVRRLATIWQEWPRLRTGATVAAGEPAHAAVAPATVWQFSTPRISLYQSFVETLRTGFFALIRKVRGAKAAKARTTASAAPKLGCYLNLGV